MIRTIAQAVVLMLALLILIAEVQRYDDIVDAAVIRH